MTSTRSLSTNITAWICGPAQDEEARKTKLNGVETSEAAKQNGKGRGERRKIFLLLNAVWQHDENDGEEINEQETTRRWRRDTSGSYQVIKSRILTAMPMPFDGRVTRSALPLRPIHEA